MENKYICSVDIGGTKIVTAIMEHPADACPIPYLRLRFPPRPKRAASPSSAHEASIKPLEANPDVEVLGVGIGAAGVVDPKTGAIAYANEIMPGWSGSVGAASARGPGLLLPLWATCRLMSWRGPLGRRQGQVLRLVPWHRNGYRRRICRERRVMQGFHGAAGHMGHIECSVAAGIPCACGRSGHLESVASGTSIGRMYDERFGRVDPSRPSVGRDVNDLCRAGDAKATEVIHDAGFGGCQLGLAC
ncbi:MAG: ROK family protein [Collinsella aerofaciens]